MTMRTFIIRMLRNVLKSTGAKITKIQMSVRMRAFLGHVGPICYSTHIFPGQASSSKFKDPLYAKCVERTDERPKYHIPLQFVISILSFVHSFFNIQLTLVISNSLISNNRLSRSENLVPA